VTGQQVQRAVESLSWSPAELFASVHQFGKPEAGVDTNESKWLWFKSSRLAANPRVSGDF